ncbi:hypothetical protein SG34_008740 [Thalassomonas viridans]|uniref:Uncharacterized protein n=1 Tax=Thalassomonas viridans TaxID=137584 RepID=A0AAF0CAK7_9GAMM|nr:hypothetical protein [Thalassomonas viridans]WDE06958.1 hypothetical protein SG34_008740 [Thalassomonas viridans]
MSDFTPPDDAARREQLSRDFRELSDDFNKFSEECAFLCDAFAALGREPQYITPPTGEGFGHISYWLKCRVIDYRDKIDDIRESWKELNREQE